MIIPCQPSTWYILLALSVICTCFGFAFQPLAIGPVGENLTGWIFLNENISLFGVVGMTLILISMILPYIIKAQYTFN